MKKIIIVITCLSILILSGCSEKQKIDIELSEILPEETISQTTELLQETTIIEDKETTTKENTENITEEYNEEQRVGFMANDELINFSFEKPMIQIGDKNYILGEAKVNDLLSAGANLLDGDDYYSDKITADYIVDPNSKDTFYCEFDKCYFMLKIVNPTENYIGIKDCIIYGAYMNINTDIGDDTLYLNIFTPGGIGITDSINKVKTNLGEPKDIYSKNDELIYNYSIDENIIYIINISRNYNSVVGFDFSIKLK